MHTHLPPEDPLISWDAPEHEDHDRGTLWYVIAGLFVLSCLAYSIITDAWTFSILVVGISVMYWFTHRDTPVQKTIRIWKRGFAIGQDFVEWKDCNGYYVLRGKGYAELHVEKRTGEDIKIQTGDIDPFAVHDILSGITTELQDRRERILETIIRICKL